MIFHENRLLADDSHEILYLIFFLKNGKDVAKFVACCSSEWCFKGKVGSQQKVQVGMYANQSLRSVCTSVQSDQPLIDTHWVAKGLTFQRLRSDCVDVNTSCLPKRPRQKVQTQIRLLEQQSDQGLPFLLFKPAFHS